MSLELEVRREDDRVQLLSPEVGHYTAAPARGAALTPGGRAGVLRRLGRSVELRVPAGVAGLVANDPPERILEPVGYGQVLLELTPLEGADVAAVEDEVEGSGGPVLRAAGSGRFYHRPAPDEPTFVEPGQIVEAGVVVGLVEIMKTFTHVTYSPGAGLPARARIVSFLVEDGADVAGGDALLELEEA